MKKILGYLLTTTHLVVSAKGPLTVMQPSSLAKQTVDLEASLGNFGHITYG